MSELPPGFNAIYRCKNHPDREPNPISGKLCAECHEAAVNAYAEAMIRRELLGEFRPVEDKTPWGEPIQGEKNVRKRKESIL